MAGRGPKEAVEFAATQGTLAGTTPSDSSMLSLVEVLREVERAQKGGAARAAV